GRTTLTLMHQQYPNAIPRGRAAHFLAAGLRICVRVRRIGRFTGGQTRVKTGEITPCGMISKLCDQNNLFLGAPQFFAPTSQRLANFASYRNWACPQPFASGNLLESFSMNATDFRVPGTPTPPCVKA